MKMKVTIILVALVVSIFTLTVVFDSADPVQAQGDGDGTDCVPASPSCGCFLFDTYCQTEWKQDGFCGGQLWHWISDVHGLKKYEFGHIDQRNFITRFTSTCLDHAPVGYSYDLCIDTCSLYY